MHACGSAPSAFLRPCGFEVNHQDSGPSHVWSVGWTFACEEVSACLTPDEPDEFEVPLRGYLEVLEVPLRFGGLYGLENFVATEVVSGAGATIRKPVSSSCVPGVQRTSDSEVWLSHSRRKES